MKNVLFMLSVVILLLVPAFSVQANTCKISTGHGLLEDVECDKVPDVIDNCPGFFNPDQTDQDRNGVGDVCDQFYQDYTQQFQPPQMIQPQIEYPQEKQVEQPVEKEVDKKPSQTLSEEAFPYATILTEETQVKLLSQHDLAAGGAGAVYPIRIWNKANRIKQYSLIAFNVDAFGTYRFDPGSVVLVNPNEEKTVYLYVQADSAARVGEHAFTLRVESGDELAQAVLRANVFGEEEELSSFVISDRLGVLLLTVLVIILLVTLIIVLKRQKGNGAVGRKVRYSHY